METTKNQPQDPHIDYKWNDVHENERKDMKPIIAFAPLEDKGLMINLWLRDKDSPSKIKNTILIKKIIFFTHKLIVSKREIAFIDGDVIHGGGIIPSGKRCHVYMCSLSVFSSKKQSLR